MASSARAVQRPARTGWKSLSSTTSPHLPSINFSINFNHISYTRHARFYSPPSTIIVNPTHPPRLRLTSSRRCSPSSLLPLFLLSSTYLLRTASACSANTRFLYTYTSPAMPNVSVRPAGVTVLASNLEKPDLDDRSYRVIQLSNKLEALIVHDPDTDKSSAALDVHVGNFSDGIDLQVRPANSSCYCVVHSGSEPCVR